MREAGQEKQEKVVKEKDRENTTNKDKEDSKRRKKRHDRPLIKDGMKMRKEGQEKQKRVVTERKDIRPLKISQTAKEERETRQSTDKK